jgi:hypothetical protein
MALAETRAVVPMTGVTPHIHWGPVIAGAIAAAAVSFVLLTFGAALGLALASPSPTWRDASVWLWLTTGLFLILTALASFALGGYLAGRLRTKWGAATPDEVDFRDGAHGLLVWALAVLIGGLLAAVTAASVLARAAPAAGSPTATAAEPLLSYEIDRLFRSDRRVEGDMSLARAEAGRILLAGARDLTADDRAYLVRLTSARTGLSPGDAERRVGEVLDRSRQAIRKARQSNVMLGFMTAAALLLGAAAAWSAACLGGSHRDNDVAPSWTWPPRRATIPPRRATTLP